MSGNRYAKIERGQGLPSLETLARLARVLDVRPSELLGMSDRSPRPSFAQGEGVARRRLQRLEAMVRRASPETIRLVTLLVAELERAAVVMHTSHMAPTRPIVNDQANIIDFARIIGAMRWILPHRVPNATGTRRPRTCRGNDQRRPVKRLFCVAGGHGRGGAAELGVRGRGGHLLPRHARQIDRYSRVP
jgi:transcriptional regulator with XRE-family HTH domain